MEEAAEEATLSFERLSRCPFVQLLTAELLVARPHGE